MNAMKLPVLLILVLAVMGNRSAVAAQEIFLNDSWKMPPNPVVPGATPLPWPFAGGFKEQNVWNNYQQPSDIYIHAGLDLIQDAGTEVRAVDEGYVVAIATNYPEWKTHYFFIVAREKNGNEGWCYTHLDTESYTFKLGDRIRRGQVLGRLVNFSVRKDKGVDHLHLHYVRFEKKPEGAPLLQSLFDPLLAFDWKDTAAPTIHSPLRFVRKGTLEEFPAGKDKIPMVSGRVEIIAAISDNGYEGQACDWMVPVVTVEISGQRSRPWCRLVLDQRGPLPKEQAPSALYLTSAEAQPWTAGVPRFPVVHFLKLTSTDGDGVIEQADRAQAWDTTEKSPRGKPRFPNGLYTVTVKAWDLQGNQATQSATVRVANRGEK